MPCCVMVDDNTHFMDESARYCIGRCDDSEQAEARCRQSRGRPSTTPTAMTTTRQHEGGSRRRHRQPQYRGALFQVASQFSLLDRENTSMRLQQETPR